MNDHFQRLSLPGRELAPPSIEKCHLGPSKKAQNSLTAPPPPGREFRMKGKKITLKA